MVVDVKYHAPYLYLKNANTAGRCDLYVAVIIEDGFQLVPDTTGQGAAENPLSSTNIQIHVKESAQAEGFIHQAFYPLALPGHADSTDAAVTVTVNVLDEQGNRSGGYSNRMLYRDRDRDKDPLVASNGIAYNCPYIYLDGPMTGQNGTPAYVASQTRYKPYVLLFPNGYRLLRNEIQLSAPENGIFESYIFLSNDESVGASTEPIVGIMENQSHYYDTGGHVGSFLVTVILEDNIELDESMSQQKGMARHRALRELEEEILSALENQSMAGPHADEGEPPIEPEEEGEGTAMRGVATRMVTRTPPRRKRKKAKTRNLSARIMAAIQ